MKNVKKVRVCMAEKEEWLVIELYAEKGNGDSSSFWKDKWYAGCVIKKLFPRLYALELHKHANVRMKLMAPSLDNSFRGRVRSGAEES
uniref:RNA-directed DNA polymerase, eukaryota, reverse transcriptase zinc-binding domain protein n=1 Tax=Tanacetum cinerariifolium TaxID=118510 RepID=A0A699R000_TANCI|nr:RNA-directed DNA polymerase, eukaryota, reverse transcriptase zinc-binding domain protein [Tanacetum cinerariifolium]